MTSELPQDCLTHDIVTFIIVIIGRLTEEKQVSHHRGFWREQRAAAAAAPPASTVQVRVGEDATLRCPLLDASSAAVASTLSWYRKSAGQGPQLLLSLRSTGSRRVTYGSGVGPQKVSAAADGSLLLRGVERSDSAVYYCGVSHEDADMKRQ